VRVIERPYGVLAVESSRRDELIKDLLFLASGCASISRANGMRQLLACGHADSPLFSHLVPPAGPTGG